MPERHKSLIAIVDLMADGEWHSGQHLGDQLGISRAAVWKHLSHLKELGLPLESVTGRGYRVANASMSLNSHRIEIRLQPRTRALTSLNVFPIIDSSNDWLLGRVWPATGALDVCVADCQTAGRGRRGRDWQTPFGASLALSVARRFEIGIASMGPLSVVVAVIIAEALEALGMKELGVKWPNDLYANGRKLCGVLIELGGEISGPLRAVIGMGINVALPEKLKADQPWTDLMDLSGGQAPDRNELVAELLNRLDVGLSQFERSGFEPFEDSWARLDLLRNKQITVIQGETSFPGLAQGITAEGCLRVATASGERQVSAGNVSVRQVNP